MERNTTNGWGLAGVLAGLFLLYDNINGGPLHVSLVLHEVGHGIFATILTLKPARITFCFSEGSGICHHAPAIYPFSWIISIMGVGMFIYLGGFLDISFREPDYSMMLYGDFGEWTVIKLIMLTGLNYSLVTRVIRGKRRDSKIGQNGLMREFLYQAGIKKRFSRDF